MQTESTLYNQQNLCFSYGRFDPPDPNRARLHQHNYCELLFFLQVKGVFHVNGSEYPVTSGDILVMRPMEHHYISPDVRVPYDRAVLHFSVELFDSIDPDRLFLRPFLQREPGKQNLYRPCVHDSLECQRLIKSMIRDSSRTNLICSTLQLLQKLCKMQDQRPLDSFEETPEYRIMRYISDHPQENITTQSLCQRFFISRTQLYQRFQRATGTTVSKYIATQKMNTAQQLIQNGHKPTEVYTQCGFRDYSTFYRAYIKHFGYSPTQTPKAGILE